MEFYFCSEKKTPKNILRLAQGLENGEDLVIILKKPDSDGRYIVLREKNTENGMIADQYEFNPKITCAPMNKQRLEQLVESEELDVLKEELGECSNIAISAAELKTAYSQTLSFAKKDGFIMGDEIGINATYFKNGFLIVVTKDTGYGALEDGTGYKMRQQYRAVIGSDVSPSVKSVLPNKFVLSVLLLLEKLIKLRK